MSIFPQDALAAPEKPDVRLVIDISGSMKYNDPENLRIPASKLLIKLAKKDTKLGVWTFGKYVNMLVPHDKVAEPWREKALKSTEKINSVAQFTNIGAALEKASLGQTSPAPGWERTIVLLSDGMVDISKSARVNNKEKRRILDVLIPRLKKAGFKIHAVALSDKADTDFLRTLAERTNGNFTRAKTAEDLMPAFVKASAIVNKPTEVPLIDNKFIIDSSVKEFTALIYRQNGSAPATLVDPQMNFITWKRKPKNTNWFSDHRYDLITVTNPPPGTWQIKAAVDPDNRVTVVTDLKMVVEGLPENIVVGEGTVMKMHLSERGRVLKDPLFLKLMDITFSQNTSTGDTYSGKLNRSKSGKVKAPADGIYKARLGRTLTVGDHVFEIAVDGKTFERKQSVRVKVHNKVINVENIAGMDAKGDQIKSIIIDPIDNLIDPERVNIVAEITSPNGDKALQDAYENSSGKWQVDVPAYSDAGVYEVRLQIQGTSKNGGDFKLSQGPYVIDYTEVGVTSAPLVDLDDEAQAFSEETLNIPDIDAPPEESIEEVLQASSTESLQDPAQGAIQESTGETAQEPVEELITNADAFEAENPNALQLAPTDTRSDTDLDHEQPPADDEADSQASSDGIDPMLLLVLGMGNLVLLAGAGILFFKFNRAKDNPEEDILASFGDSERIPAATIVPQLDMTFEEADASLIKPTEPAPTPAPKPDDKATVSDLPPPVVNTESIPEAENQAYTNEAAPLELDDDELIELDDFEDDDFDDLESLISTEENKND